MNKIQLITLTLITIGQLLFSQTQLIIQPNPDEGKDARIQSNIPNQNISTTQFYSAQSGTMSGVPFIDRSLLSFDLINSLPENVLIVEAKLSLYANTLNGGHSTADGSNEAWLEKIIEPWQEDIVTWNNQPATTTENRISLSESNSNDEDYLEIDVTELISQIYSNPDTGFGLMIKLDQETNKRSLQFASSDITNESIRPSPSISYYNVYDCVELLSDNIDARVQSNIPNQNISTSQLLAAQSGTMGGVPFIDRSLVNFEIISALPNNAVVIDAKLSLYANTVNGGHTITDGTNESWLERVVEPWLENTVTWNNQPATSIENRISLAESNNADQNYINIDVLELINDMINNPNESYGFLFKLKDETLRRSLQFGSSNAPSSAIHPKLSICYIVNTSTESEFKNKPIIELSPSPMTDYLNIKIKNAEVNSIVISDLSGKQISQYVNKNKESLTLDLAYLPKGLYLVSFLTDSSIITKKIVKN